MKIGLEYVVAWKGETNEIDGTDFNKGVCVYLSERDPSWATCLEPRSLAGR